MSGPVSATDDLRGARLNAGDRAQQLNGPLETGDAFLDRFRAPLDLLIEEIEVGEDRPDQQRVRGAKAALEGVLVSV